MEKSLKQFEQLKKNIVKLDQTIQEAPCNGISREGAETIMYVIYEMLNETGLTINGLKEELNKLNKQEANDILKTF